MNEMAIVEDRALTAVEVRAQVNLIQEVLKGVMKADTHYGIIPGCKQPSLFKPGAEKILSTFRIAVDPDVEDLSTHDEAKYRVKAKGISMASGNFLGGGIGECSSDEEKYKWKKAVCNEEYEATPADRRREKWFKGYQNKPNYQVKQVRTNPADVANTILKMAKKRAQIDLTLTVTAASDIFTQDIEDLPEGMDLGERETKVSKTSTVKPRSASKTSAKTSAKKEDTPQEEGDIRAKLKDLLGKAYAGDTDKMQAALKEVSVFMGKDQEGNEEEKFITAIDNTKSDKWVRTSYGKLKTKLINEKSIPKDCTLDPNTCSQSSFGDGLAYCGEKDCPMQANKEF